MDKKTTQLNMCHQWDEILFSSDINDDGRLDWHELFIMAVDHDKALQREHLHHIFHMLDQDSDGYFSEKDAASIIESKAWKDIFEQEIYPYIRANTETIGEDLDPLKGIDEDCFINLVRKFIPTKE